MTKGPFKMKGWSPFTKETPRTPGTPETPETPKVSKTKSSEKGEGTFNKESEMANLLQQYHKKTKKGPSKSWLEGI